jgi:endo-1,4-beta-xylanase
MKNFLFKLIGSSIIFWGFVLLQSCTGGPKNPENKTLSGAYRDYFSIGAAVSPRMIAGNDTVFILKQFNSITADNCMKPEVLQPAEGKWNWAGADKLVDFAVRNGIKIRGHCLLWHQQTPDWFFLDGDKPASKELVLKRLREHIFTVMNRYKGKVYCWDVVNEAVADDTSRIYREKDSKWFQLTGQEYVIKAFEYAHEADPQALLFYNDYNTANPEKRERIYRFLKGLLEKGIPVQGMGMQGHWSIFEPSEKDLRAAIERYSSLGLQIHITELDLSVYKWEKEHREKMQGEDDSFTPEKQKLQNEKYEMIFRVFRDYSKVISSVTFWGVTDNRSWLNYYPVKGRKNYPLLFDQNFEPKPAFFELVNFK